MRDYYVCKESDSDHISSAICCHILTNEGLNERLLDSITHEKTTYQTSTNVKLTGRNILKIEQPLVIIDKPPEFSSVAIVSHPYCDIYYHWVLDILPLIYKIGLSNLDINTILLPKPKYSYQDEWLGFLPPIVPLGFLDDKKSIYANSITLPSPSTSGTQAAPWALDFIRQIASPISKNKNTPRIYLRRSGNVTRKITNEAELEVLLMKLGFVAYDTATMNVKEQISLSKGAEIIVSSHGSGLTNIIFCDPGTVVVEIFGPYCGETCYQRISADIRLRHIGVQANSITYTCKSDKELHDADSHEAPFHFSVSLNQIGEAIKIATNADYKMPIFI